MTAAWQEKSLGDVVHLAYGKPLDEADRNPSGKHPVYGANGEKDRTDKFYHAKESIISDGKVPLVKLRLPSPSSGPLT